MTASLPEQRYLTLRAAQLQHPAPPADPVGCLFTTHHQRADTTCDVLVRSAVASISVPRSPDSSNEPGADVKVGRCADCLAQIPPISVENSHRCRLSNTLSTVAEIPPISAPATTEAARGE